MKEINLRDYYPFYTKDTVVEVPDEVADLLREYKLSEAAHFLRTYRHKAYFSLDYDKNVERDALVIMLAPEDVLVQRKNMRGSTGLFPCCLKSSETGYARTICLA